MFLSNQWINTRTNKSRTSMNQKGGLDRNKICDIWISLEHLVMRTAYYLKISPDDCLNQRNLPLHLNGKKSKCSSIAHLTLSYDLLFSSDMQDYASNAFPDIWGTSLIWHLCKSARVGRKTLRNCLSKTF